MLLGSHYDTVIDGGRFDGALGVAVAVSAVKALLAERPVLRCPVRPCSTRSAPRAHLPRRPQLEVVAFSDEEGVRFHSTFLGSKAVVGGLSLLELAMTDEAGISLGQARRREARGA